MKSFCQRVKRCGVAALLSGLAFSARAAWAESPAAPPLNLESRLERLEKLVQEVEEDQNRLNQIAQQMVQGRSGQGGNLGSNSVGRRRKLPPAKDVSGEFEGHRYRFIATPCTWEEAHLAARQEGGHLLVIGSQGEQDFAESLLREAAEGALPPTWIGLVKKGESEWEWVNGEKASFFTGARVSPTMPAATKIVFISAFLGTDSGTTTEEMLICTFWWSFPEPGINSGQRL